MKALGVNMRLISVLFMISVMASAVQARVVATFNCEVIAATSLGIEEGRKKFALPDETDYGKQVRIRVIMEPNPNYNWYQVDVSVEFKGSPFYTNFPIQSYDNIMVSDDEIKGGTWYGGFRLSADRVQFFSDEATAIYLRRYYRSDFNGLMITGGSGTSSWTNGLNCQSSKYNEQDFINFHNSWDK